MTEDGERRAKCRPVGVWVGALPKGQTTFALKDRRGAIFLEKLIVFTPLLVLFFLGFQLAEASAAQLVVRRASSAAARAAAVVLPDDPAFYDGIAVNTFEGARKDDIYLAAAMTLAAAPQLDGDFDVSVSEIAVSAFGPIDVTIAATYHCGRVSLLCGLDGSLSLEATTRQAYHRAQYDYELLPGSAPAGVPGQEDGSGLPVSQTLAMASRVGPPTSDRGLVDAINRRCGCQEQPRATDALCISKTVIQEIDATLAPTFAVGGDDTPDLSHATFAKVENLINAYVSTGPEKRRLLDDLQGLTDHDYLATLQIIKRTIDAASSPAIQSRSEGRVTTQTVYRLDTRPPTPQGWNGTPYMVANPNDRRRVADDAEPWGHFRSGSEGSRTYVSASGTGYFGHPVGEDLRRQNSKLGDTPYFLTKPFLCIKRDVLTHAFVTSRCEALHVFKLSTNFQYVAPGHATYAPRHHPIPAENEVLTLFVKPTSYRQIIYVEFFAQHFAIGETREKHLSYTHRMRIEI